MQGYVNINEASRLTGKHKDTIRRLVKNNKGGNNIVTGRKKEYLINKEWLLNIYELTPENTTHTEAPQQAKQPKDDIEHTPEPTGEANSLYKTLAKQLEAKDQQIAELQKLLHEKEANNTKINDQFQQLMGRFMLPATTPTEAQPDQAEPKQTQADVSPVTKPRRTVKKTPSLPQVKATPKKKPVKSKAKPKTALKPVAKEQEKPKRRWFRR